MMSPFQQTDFAQAIALIERTVAAAPAVRQLRWTSNLIIYGHSKHPEMCEFYMRIVQDRIVSALLRQLACASTLKHSTKNKRTAKLSTWLSAVPTQSSSCSSLNCDGEHQ